jgi:hypothetical protein
MATIKEYFEYSELAQAAYGNLEFGAPSISELINKDRADFTDTQADVFSMRYKVLAVSKDYVSGDDGFSATLFAELNADGVPTGTKILSFRGTEPTDTGDLIADWDLVLSKHPEQYASMVSFVEQLISSQMIKTSDTLIATGHSLGGALAQYVAYNILTCKYFQQMEFSFAGVKHNCYGSKQTNPYM